MNNLEIEKRLQRIAFIIVASTEKLVKKEFKKLARHLIKELKGRVAR